MPHYEFSYRGNLHPVEFETVFTENSYVSLYLCHTYSSKRLYMIKYIFKSDAILVCMPTCFTSTLRGVFTIRLENFSHKISFNAPFRKFSVDDFKSIFAKTRMNLYFDKISMKFICACIFKCNCQYTVKKTELYAVYVYVCIWGIH